MSPKSVLVVAFGTGAIITFPTFPAIGGSVPQAVPLGFAAIPVATLLWGSLRWRPRHPPQRHVRLRTALIVGAFLATAFSGVATIPVLLILIGGILDHAPRNAAILLVCVAYYVGFLGAGWLFWLLQRIRHLATGRCLIGTLCGICVYGAVTPIVALFDGRPMSVSEGLICAAIAGGIVGPAVGLTEEDDIPANPAHAAGADPTILLPPERE